MQVEVLALYDGLKAVTPFAAAIAIGIALGLSFGRLLTALVVNYESAQTAVSSYTKAVAFVLGAGGGAALFKYLEAETDVVFVYLLGLGIGMTGGFFMRLPQAPLTLERLVQIIDMADALRPTVKDSRRRAILILATMVPTKVISRAYGLTKAQWAKSLEDAADILGDQIDGDNGD
jgi:hypothetical protein